MKFLFELILRSYLQDHRCRRVCEIGAGEGAVTDALLRIPALKEIVVMDPCLVHDLEKKYAGNSRVELRRGTSLEMLAALGAKDAFDAIMVDGDHNWYTVYHELSLIRERGLLADSGALFFHDTSWPYGRRDRYYAPAAVPEAFRHPFERQGVVRGRSALSPEGMNPRAFHAVHEGGPRNGVMTAIEDYQKEAGHPFWQASFNPQFGLCALVPKKGVGNFCRLWEIRARFMKAGIFGRETSPPKADPAPEKNLEECRTF